MEHEVSTPLKVRITPQEYLELERKSAVKSEYFDGEMFEMPGVTYEHGRILLNLAAALQTQCVERGCAVNGPELRVKISATGLYTYPDLLIVMGEPRFEESRRDTLLNPIVLIEVLSDSTEAYDRGEKFAHYRTIETLREYVLVSQNECRIERFEKQDDGRWLLSETTGMEGFLELLSVSCRVPLSRIYEKIDFVPAGERASRSRRPQA
jgi:Uma2 family endonuclease